MAHYLQFDTFDNPMQLSKVGNWIITFLSPKDELNHIQLAITHVLPRQICDHLQPRRLIMHSTLIENCWEIENIECFDSSLNKEIAFQPESPQAQTVIQTILKEFDRYDVCVKFKQDSSS
ncbi:hypothetical protein [Acinetobacter pragensis]|uniref:Uncharacterized protein n=1 Tax=Acinetobacter pragensis TaxID=1806892 RepID=A0A151XZF4_9GAMM|nr:hypothetical protein [Acinetobacter pragensis]KYQ70989.1 hypothetical protein AZH43_16485 [Acinetobacter pragensis]